MDDTLSDELSQGKLPDRLADVVDNMSIGYLAIVLAVAGLGGAWRDAQQTSQPPEFVGQWIHVIAGIVWTALVVLALFKAPLSNLRSARR